MAIQSRFVLRALLLSLTFHAWLLLQSPSHVSLPASLPMEVDLRPAAPGVAKMPLPDIAHEARRESAPPARAAAALPRPAPHANAARARADNAIALEGADLAEVRKSYVFDLARAARRIKSGVMANVSQREHGLCEVRVMVNGGDVPRASLQASSGNARIDAAALELVEAALAKTAVPPDLRGEPFDLVLPLHFGD